MEEQVKEQKRESQLIKKISRLLADYFKWVVAALTIALLAAGYFFLLAPKYKQIVEGLKLASEKQEEEYYEGERYLAQLNKLNTAYKNISPEDLKKIENLLPDKAGLEDLLVQAEAIASLNGMTLTSLEIGADENGIAAEKPAAGGEAKAGNKPASNIAQVGLNMSLVGVDYVGLKNVLKTIENNLRIMDVTGLEFSPAENTVSLKILTYYLKEKK